MPDERTQRHQPRGRGFYQRKRGASHGPGFLRYPRQRMGRRRRTAGIQHRERASSEALSRRVGEQSSGGGLPDWRLLAIGGVLLIGTLVVILVLIMGSAPNPDAGTAQPDAGQTHVETGDCRADPANCGGTSNPYTSLPATSGPHWATPANWGVYSTPQAESQVIHNLEHGGIVIWYDPEALDLEQIGELASYVEAQLSQGHGGRFKFILTPWGGEDELGSPIVLTAWRYLLPLEDADRDAIDGFVRARYGIAPEPQGGPGPPG